MTHSGTTRPLRPPVLDSRLAPTWLVARRLITPRLLSVALLVSTTLLPPTALGADRQSEPESVHAAPSGLLLISIDTLRADALGPEGLGRADGLSDTPVLDRLASESIVFAQAYAPIPHTLPSHVSLFTGLAPGVHRVFGEPDRLSAAVDSLPARLAAEGWQTAGIVSNYWLAPVHGLERGFDAYQFLHPADHRAGAIARVARSELDRLAAGEAPWFLFVHLMDPHSDPVRDQSTTPYLASDRFRHAQDWPQDDSRFCAERTCATRRLQAANRGESVLDPEQLEQVKRHYRAGVRETDAALGTLFDHLRSRGLFDDTLIVVVSDHGESLGESGRFIHGTPAEAALRVPLLIKLNRPGSQEPYRDRPTRAIDPDVRQVDALVETIDVYPTLLDWLGLAPATTTTGQSVDGESLVPLWRGRDGEPSRRVTARPDVLLQGKNRFLAALRRGPWKLVYDATDKSRRLFYLPTDPFEEADLAPLHPERTEALHQRLIERLRDQRRRWVEVPEPEAATPLDGETKSALRALGYLGSARD